jgi:ABC-type multidrug transport system fused ATPase/permease subunit
MKATSEVFGSMLAVKLNAWEERFLMKISAARADELVHVWQVRSYCTVFTLYECKHTLQVLLLGAYNIFLLWLAPLAVSVVTFAVYAWPMGETLTAAKIFTGKGRLCVCLCADPVVRAAIALFRLLQEPLRSLPTYITKFIQAGVSVDRLEKLLQQQDRSRTRSRPALHP